MDCKFLFYLSIVFLLHACGGAKNAVNPTRKTAAIKVDIDLVNVVEDRVQVTIRPHIVDTAKVLVYAIPKIVPGTYSVDNYGAYIQDFKAYASKNAPLIVTKKDTNRWEIKTTAPLEKITYWVNDTYDIESEHSIFSPSGTNILKDQNFVLNLHGFVGYFENHMETPYTLSIEHPEKLKGITSLTKLEAMTPAHAAQTTDRFSAERYSEVADSPILYAAPDLATFKINDIEVTLCVYSPNKRHTAASMAGAMEKMMRAQKAFLGPINATKKYHILLYLSDMSPLDAKGFGALEHNTSTLVVLPEVMPLPQLKKTMIDVVSHEFFHIVTPLSIHSKEIHFFDYNNPKMSQHLWLYEGTTEYFAHLFQIQQKLISVGEFYERIMAKVSGAQRFDDHMSFTEMSKNILQQPYKDNYINVYEKGTLIAMCIDIIIREQSNGAQGILDLMKALSNKYGSHQPFDDDQLIGIISALGYPEVGVFLEKHVQGTTAIPYEMYWNKLGLELGTTVTEGQFFASDQQPFVTRSADNMHIEFVQNVTFNDFLTALGIQGGDRLEHVNGKKYNLQNATALFEDTKNWQAQDTITFGVLRNGTSITLEGTVRITKLEKAILRPIPNADATQLLLHKAWIGNSK